MNGSMIATAYLISLGIFFIFLVIATIVYMVSKATSKSKKKKNKADRYDYDEDDEYEDYEDDDSSIFDEAYAQKTRTSLDDEIDSVAADVAEAMKSLNKSMETARISEAKPAQPMQQAQPVQPVQPVQPMQPAQPMAPVTPELDSAFAPEPEQAQPEASVSPEFDSAFAPEPGQVQQAQQEASVSPEFDSAFAPEPELPQSVTPAAPIMSNKPPVGDYIWFNKEDVADRPDYKPEEMYYHHFHSADECIEELLMEMYDCALVRTEEIRYIAYGIEPRDVAMRDVLATGAAGFNASRKKKEPNTEDLARIYDKWCSYVDKLFEKVEVRADEATVVEIRRLLCEYGKKDVDTLIQGV